MAQNVILKAKGISVDSNPLGATPEGSMSEALNVVIDRDEIVEPRRGFFEYGTSFGAGNDRTKQLFNYKDRILRHVLDKLQFDADNNGLFLDINNPSTVNEIKSGLRIKAIEANGNFYFVSSTGVKKISARVATDLFNATIQLAGGVKALNVNALANFTSLGFLEPNAKVAYRIVFGIKDINENLILGTPSSRVVVYNITTDSCNVDINFTLPSEIDSTNYFYQVYRTGVFSAAPGTEAPDPGDEMNLVLEDTITSAQLTAGEVLLTDITPETFRKNGALLYTNPNSGEGIEQSNERPPFGSDIALYKGYTFLANTKTVQRLNLSFLSIQNLIDGISNFTITDTITSTVYTFQGYFETFALDYVDAVYSDFVNAAPAEAKYFTLISANEERKYLIYYYETVNDQEPSLPGYVNIKVTLAPGDTITDIIDKTITEIETATDDFNLSVAGTILTVECSNNGYVNTLATTTITPLIPNLTQDGNGLGEDIPNKKIFLPKVPTGDQFGPTTSQQLEQVAKSFERVVNANDALVYAYYSSGFDDIPGQLLLENRDIVGGVFYLTSNAGDQFNPTVPANLITGNQVFSNNEVRPNRIHYSKFQQPESFPLANYIDIGPKDREIKRIIPLRDSLFILKEDGVYRLSGDVAPFTVAPFDFSVQVLAPDSAVVLNNQIYVLSTQGVVVITDTGVSVISSPIENVLLKLIKQAPNYKTISFGVSYESDRAYHLWLPTNSSDAVATQCYRYNTFTNSWTRWDNSKTCGLVNFADDRMYLGAGDENFIEKERKDLSRIDQADRQYELQVVLNKVVDNQLELNLINNVQVGDILLQKQYLTITQFNRILLKLDTDITVNQTDFYSTLKMDVGMNLRTQLNLLAAKLDADTGLTYTNYQTLIQNYSATINLITPNEFETIVQTTTPHNIVVNRFINIGGTDSSPSIDGSYKVIAVTPTTLTIDKTIAFSGTTGTLQTNINNFIDIQTCFNLIVNNLNDDPGAFYSNYDQSEDSTEFEGIVIGLNKPDNIVFLKNNLPLVFGDITLYKAIKSKVIWNPQFFQDPTVEKQITQGTMMFEDTNFSTVSIGYSSDLSPSFEDTEFNGAGNGDWGQFNWGGVNWGGIGAPVPLRTYIPLEKQRCRFMNVKFEHKVAFEKYSIYGLSLTFRPYNIKAYK